MKAKSSRYSTSTNFQLMPPHTKSPELLHSRDTHLHSSAIFQKLPMIVNAVNSAS